MKKRMLLIVLAVLMVFVTAACQENVNHPTNAPTDPPEPTYPVLDKVSAVEPAKNTDGAYVLTQPGHVAYMAEHPAETYVLGADIDMGGAGWTPIADFSGKLSGKIHNDYNYTISNLTIQVAEDATNVGFFATVTGDVEDVIFKNVSIVSLYPFSGHAGIAVGQTDKELSDVDVKNGSITLTVKDAKVGGVCGTAGKADNCDSNGVMNITLDGGKSYVGGILGYTAKAVSSLDSRMEINISGTAAGAAGGTIGYAGGKTKTQNFGGKLTVTADNTFAAGVLIGELNASLENSQNCAEGNTVTGAVQHADAYYGIAGTNGKVTNCVTRDPKTLESLIPAAEYALRKQVVDYMYELCTYRWIPTQDMEYNDCDCGGKGHPQSFKAGTIYFGPVYSHLALSLEASKSVLNPDGTLKDTVPATGFHTMFGNDCADSIYWALSQISAEVNYVLTKDAASNMGSNGLYPVGGYTLASTTADICAANGKDVIYEAYAQTKLGDTLLGTGHIRLAAENAYVFRDADGKIDPARSYLLLHEQGMPTKDLNKNHSSCQVFGKYTFQQLFANNYVPQTIKAYTQGEDKIEVSTTNTATDKSGVCAGTVSSNYRLNNVTVKITDSTGAVVFEKTQFPLNNNTSNTDSYALSNFQADLNQVSLTAGAEYTYEVFVFVSGESVSVQSFKFTA